MKGVTIGNGAIVGSHRALPDFRSLSAEAFLERYEP